MSLRKYHKKRSGGRKIKRRSNRSSKRRVSSTRRRVRSTKRRVLRGHSFGAQTSFPNALAAPYFGYQEPFIQASEWWYPVADGAYQSPQMLQNFSFGARNRRRHRKSFRFGKKKSQGCGCN